MNRARFKTTSATIKNDEELSLMIEKLSHEEDSSVKDGPTKNNMVQKVRE